MKTSDPPQPSVDAVRERIQRIETLFQEQVAKGQFDNARLIVDQIGRFLPGEPLVYSMRGRLMLAEGNYDGAKRWLAEGLTRHPHHFDLLFLLGEAFERQQERLNAYHMYAQAEFVAVGREQKDQIRDVIVAPRGKWPSRSRGKWPRCFSKRRRVAAPLKGCFSVRDGPV